MSAERPKYDEHPAYGVAVFNRMQGRTARLFGSPLKDHSHTVQLTIMRAAIKHDLGQDWIHSAGGQELITVTLSPAQFADLLTNMNVGDGVPCTIERVQGERMPDVPEDEPVEHEKVVDAFKVQNQETVDRLKEQLVNIRELLKKPKLSQEDKRDIEWIVGKALQDVGLNAPFMLEQFGAAATKVVTHARAEMGGRDAYRDRAARDAEAGRAAGRGRTQRVGGKEDMSAPDSLRPTARKPFWQYVNEPHHWVRRAGVGRYYDCAVCGEFVMDMAPPQVITWPWRFNTVGPCIRRSKP